jgi:hypothetical protein
VLWIRNGFHADRDLAYPGASKTNADPDPGRALRHKELNYTVHEKYRIHDVDYRSINIPTPRSLFERLVN